MSKWCKRRDSLAENGSLWQVPTMAHASLLEQPVVVHTRPAIDMDDEQFFQFCRVNRDLQIERTAEGDILIMAPEAGSSGHASAKLVAVFQQWAEREATGRVFGPSTGFNLPNGGTRSPDIAWVSESRLKALTDEQWQKFLPLCPEFVLELRSPSDGLHRLKQKMEEYRENGAQLGWLLDPVGKQVFVYKAGGTVEVLEKPSTLSGEPVLRGFVLELPPVWAALERRKG
jgi:Uma2 family endonuclease